MTLMNHNPGKSKIILLDHVDEFIIFCKLNLHSIIRIAKKLINK